MVEPLGAMSQVRALAIDLRFEFEHSLRQAGFDRLRSGMWVAILTGLIMAISHAAAAQGSSVPPEDSRNTQIPTVDTPAALPQFSSLKAWEERRAILRNQILVSAGLSP